MGYFCYRCTTCNYRFHQKCAKGIPPLCEQAEHNQIYQEMLAKQHQNNNSNLPSTPRPISQRERSISAPNVNMIGQGTSSDLIEVSSYPSKVCESFKRLRWLNQLEYFFARMSLIQYF